jgi:hypothetical protein
LIDGSAPVSVDLDDTEALDFTDHGKAFPTLDIMQHDEPIEVAAEFVIQLVDRLDAARRIGPPR